MRIYKITLTLLVFVLLVVFTVSLDAQDDATVSDPAEIIQALGEALNAGDADLAMTYIADNAYFGTYDMEAGVRAGNDEIRILFDELVAGNFRIETNIIATYGDGSILISDTQTWADWMIEAGLAPFNATEVYVVKNGLITGITWVMSVETQQRVMTAMAPPVITADDLVGAWQWGAGQTGVQFFEDGTYRWSYVLFNLMDTSPVDVGTYVVEDNVLTMTSDESINSYCEIGDAGIYALELDEDGTLYLIIQSDACSRRRAPSTQPQPFIRHDDDV